MQSLLLVAHGSRKDQSNEEVHQLSAQLAERAQPHFGFTQCAFLELAEPTLVQGLEQCIQAGATEIVVLPYFLAAGQHVSGDIPVVIANTQQEHPHIKIKLMPHLGSAHDAMVDILLSLVDV